MIELAVRLVFSLAVVIGLLLLVVRVGGRRFRGRSGAMVQVVHRQSLSRSSGVAVVTVGTRVLVLGTTEQQVTVLAELDPDEIDLPDDGRGAYEDDEDGTVEELFPHPALTVLPQLPGGAAHPVRPTSVRPTPTTRSAGRHAAAPSPSNRPLAGSVLSPDTWRQALAAATRRTS